MSANSVQTCPTAEQLFKLLSPELDDAARDDLERHVESCENCRDRFRAIRHGTETQILGKHGKMVDSQPILSAEIPPELQDHARYRVLKFLGGGGMGMVYKAEHRLLERPVVLKLIRPNLVERDDIIERFRRESRLAAKLSHPNIVAIYEAEQVGTMHLLVMEYLEGNTLAGLAHLSAQMPIAQACELIRQAAMGLQHIHERGLVHRDIKPSNLLVTPDGQVKILDMGLAILKAEHNAGTSITGEMQMLGTIDYAAPEQWGDSRAVDIRADIYSLGCTLYHLLTGGAPFSDTKFSTIMKKMWAHGYAPIPPIRELRPEVPEPLATVIEFMLAKDRENRFATPAEVADSLAPFAATAERSALSLGLLDTATGSQSSAATVTANKMRTSTRINISPPNPSIGSSDLWHRRLAIVAVGLGIALAAWRLWSSNYDRAALVKDTKPIRVGVLHSLSGTMKDSESGVVDATLLAIREINEAGGLLGRKIEPIVVDGQSDAAVFAREAENLIVREKVNVVFGCWTSASRKTVRPVFEKHNHLLVYPVQYEGLEQSKNIVYLGAAPNQQILPAVRWSFTDLGRRFFLVGSDYVFPRTANAILRDEIKRLGGEVVDERYLQLGSSDVADVVKRIVETKPTVILNTINGDSNTAFFRALRSAGITPATIPTVSFSIAEPELASLQIKDVLGDYAAWNYFQSVDRSENRAFVEKFKSTFGPGRVTSDPMECAYCGVHLWAKAVEAAQVVDVFPVRKAMLQQSFDGPGSTIRIDPETQHAWKIARIGRIGEKGQFELVNSSEKPIKPIPFPASRTVEQWNAFLADLQNRWSGKWYNDRSGKELP